MKKGVSIFFLVIWAAMSSPDAFSQGPQRVANGNCVPLGAPESEAPVDPVSDVSRIRPWILENGTWKKSEEPLFQLSFSAGTNRSWNKQYVFDYFKNFDSAEGSNEPGSTVQSSVGAIEMKVRPFYLFDVWKTTLEGRINGANLAEENHEGRILVESNVYVRMRKKLWQEGVDSKNYLRFEVYVNHRHDAGQNGGDLAAVGTVKHDTQFQSKGSDTKTTLSFGAGVCVAQPEANLAAVFDVFPASIEPRGKITGTIATMDVRTENKKIVFSTGVGLALNLTQNHYTLYHQFSPGGVNHYKVVSEENDMGILHAKFTWKDFLPKSDTDLSLSASGGLVFPMNGLGYNQNLKNNVGSGVFYRIDSDGDPMGISTFTAMEVKWTIPIGQR